MTIEEIAAKHGFPSVRSFNEVFPRYTGVTPAEDRRRHQKDTIQYKDFAGEEVDLDFLRNGEEGDSVISSNQGCSVTITLPKGSYEVLRVETGDDNVSSHATKMNGKKKNINIDSNCSELILRIRKR